MTKQSKETAKWMEQMKKLKTQHYKLLMVVLHMQRFGCACKKQCVFYYDTLICLAFVLSHSCFCSFSCSWAVLLSLSWVVAPSSQICFIQPLGCFYGCSYTLLITVHTSGTLLCVCAFFATSSNIIVTT